MIAMTTANQFLILNYEAPEPLQRTIPLMPKLPIERLFFSAYQHPIDPNHVQDNFLVSKQLKNRGHFISVSS